MKKYLIAFGAVVVVALMLVSIADGQKPLTDVQEVTVTCVVRPGDTLWNIAEGFYGHGISAEDYNAFQYRISQDNKELFAEGRQLQVGDKVKIRYYTKR